MGKESLENTENAPRIQYKRTTKPNHILPTPRPNIPGRTPRSLRRLSIATLARDTLVGLGGVLYVFVESCGQYWQLAKKGEGAVDSCGGVGERQTQKNPKTTRIHKINET